MPNQENTGKKQTAEADNKIGDSDSPDTTLATSRTTGTAKADSAQQGKKHKAKARRGPFQEPSGPRTRGGRPRPGTNNAATHNIFTQGLLKDERRLYRRLLRGLRDDLRSVGALAELEVREIAFLYVRKMRVQRAEKAEIQIEMHTIYQDSSVEQMMEFNDAEGSLVTWTGGMLECGANPLIVRRCIDLLRDWREKFAKTGFDLQCDTNLLACVFGWKRLDSAEYGLPGVYRRLFVLAEKAGKGEADSTFSFEEVKKKMLLQVDSEITRLTKIQEVLEKNQTELLANQAQSHLVPAPAERYMKYETWLDHRIEKILDRLGRRYPWQRWKEE